MKDYKEIVSSRHYRTDELTEIFVTYTRPGYGQARWGLSIEKENWTQARMSN